MKKDKKKLKLEKTIIGSLSKDLMNQIYAGKVYDNTKSVEFTMTFQSIGTATGGDVQPMATCTNSFACK